MLEPNFIVKISENDQPVLPADSELEAIETKSLQIFSQNLLACSRSLALSFSWANNQWSDIKLIDNGMRSLIISRVQQTINIDKSFNYNNIIIDYND